jgi:hypothetical protein
MEKIPPSRPSRGLLTPAERAERVKAELEAVRRLFERVRTHGPRKSRGRPWGSTTCPPAEFRERLPHAYAAVALRKCGKPTQLEVAAEMGLTGSTLSRYLRDNGVPWPPTYLTAPTASSA